MTIKLLHHSPLWLASHAIRMSHDNHDKSDTFVDYGTTGDTVDYYDNEGFYRFYTKVCGTKDKALIDRVGNKLKHKSVLEQLVYWFDIDGISRACLQELARHRTARLTVKSSRYTLNELKGKKEYLIKMGTVTEDVKDCSNYCVMSAVPVVNQSILASMNTLIFLVNQQGLSNDQTKYCLPEAFKTHLQWQIDGRNLQNFLALRTSKEALWEIQQLARSIYDALPEEHKYLYSEYVMDSTNPSVVGGNTETTV